MNWRDEWKEKSKQYEKEVEKICKYMRYSAEKLDEYEAKIAELEKQINSQGRLFDDNGVELFEWDSVFNVQDTFIAEHNIVKEFGLLINPGLHNNHRSNRNNGRLSEQLKSEGWKVIKKVIK